MAYRNNNRRNNGGGGGGNFGNNYGNAGRINPWDTGVGGGRGNNDALTLANSLINNLLRNQNTNQVPPSLLDGVQSSRFDDMNGFNFIRNDYISRLNLGYQRRNPIQSSNNNNKNKNSNKQGANKKGNSSNAGNNNKQSKTSQYAEVSNEYLYCHMCDKHMYDATSFENHVTGRTHRVMKESIEESYRMRATLLRQEARIAEQLKTIEIDRLKRMGKAKNYSKMREYCPMCELFFYGHIIAHRRSEKHLDLKKFLHPKCDDCELEFHNRTEYDDHLLSVVHMKNCKTKPCRLDIEKRAKQLIISTAHDELLDIREETAPKNKKKDKEAASSAAKKTEQKATPAAVTAESGENGDAAKPDSEKPAEKSTTEDGATEEAKLEEDVPEDEVVKDEESEDCILDYKPGDEISPEIDNKLPRYKKNRALGLSLIGKLECHECRICHKYFDNEATGEIHARTHSHYRAFIRFLNEKALEVRISQKRAAVALEEAETAKKQKLATEEKKAEENGAEAQKKDSDLYDPSEATGEESADASMADDSKSEEANGGNSESQSEPMETENTETNKAEASTPADDKSTASSADTSTANKPEETPKEESKPEKEEPKATPAKNNKRGRGGRSGRYSGRY
ncbi:zinc finger protein on ecdysone puffs isoform X2 [Toxorhynchites rutilus septentrionalis]|uniref:zinc finger protein on ecdysone puffs isoform X2 n=1 Tax=Toxorhynchites rutilus septentrionalis TaxID=329112 RepID=UPI00247A830B|nr:zinc finger protein on ecdysone puffs isoform X2 [Toxorhynchites rutilus septentrionalis]